MRNLVIVGYFVFVGVVSVPASAITLYDVTPAGFIGAIDMSGAYQLIFGISAGLFALAALMVALVKGLLMMSGKVVVKGHGLFDRDVYESAMQDLDRHHKSGGILDTESRQALAAWQLDHLDPDDDVEDDPGWTKPSRKEGKGSRWL